MDPLVPREQLLLTQAVYREGASSPAGFEAVSRLLLAHPAMTATARRNRASLNPAACSQHYRAILASEGMDSTKLPADLKRPHARAHLKLARKYYSARLSEVRDQLAAEEASMRTLQKEIDDIQNGRWDDRLTSSLILVQPAQGADPARYGHPSSASIQDIPPTPSLGLPPQSLPEPSASESTADEPSIAQVANEMAEQAEASLEQPADTLVAEGTAGLNVATDIMGSTVASPLPLDQQLADIPEETQDGSAENATKLSTSKPPAGRASKATLSERRSSMRVSRNSIASLSELLQAGDGAASTSILPSEDYAEKGSANKTHLSPHSAPMELDSSRDSQPPVKKGGRGGRRASISREGNKRKRTATPNDIRGPSPALSDRSRSKRIKTEELDSSVSTPAEHERTPFGSDASARRFRAAAPHLISQMQGNIHSTFFKDPVRPGEALNYFEIVKRPMDLKTLLQNVKSGRVASTIELRRDVALIFANAVMYNGQDHHVGQDAVAMWAEVQALFSVLEHAEQRAT